ncbi:MAG: methionine--tRNA ligase [Patescibacteria group bacterium]
MTNSKDNNLIIHNMYIITTPIPYTNAEAHLGHLLEGLYTDTIRRYQQFIKKSPTLLTMGLDQHGLKIYQTAIEKGLKPEVFVENTGQTFLKLWHDFDVKFDTFVPTHSKRHIKITQALFRTLKKNGHIYEKEYKGSYCVGCEDFYAPSQLIEENKCPIHLKPVIELQEINQFFRLSEFEEEINNFLDVVQIYPENIKNEWRSFMKQGLLDVSCTREKSRLPWGIEVPDDDKQVMYVWIEALMNYCTAIFTEEESESMSDEQIVEKLRNTYPIDLMYCSKEIAKFHLIIFPALLTALDIRLPKKCVVHGMINDSNGLKMSKSLGNSIFPAELKKSYTNDEIRFIFLHEINLIGDSNYNQKRINENYNIFLSNNLGNIFTRATTMGERYGYEINKKDLKFNWKTYLDLMENGNTKLAFDEIFNACSVGNEFLEEHKPWEIAKNPANEELLRNVLGSIINHIKDIAYYLQPFMPETSNAYLELLNQKEIKKIEPLFLRKEV